MKIGFICSAFDLLHAGHILALKEAKSKCDYLIVGLHVDPSKERKGKTKPVQSLLEREIQLSGCKYVDYIVVYETEKELEIMLTIFHIDVRFLGEDYKKRKTEVTGEKLVPIEYLNRKHPYSSTELKGRIKHVK